MTSSQRLHGAQIQFATQVFDFGRLESGHIVNHEFAFTNVGNETLVITDVRPSCGCTTTTGWARRIEPGQRGAVPVRFDSSGFGGDTTKTISVICNDPSQSNVVLQVKGHVWRAIEVEPSSAVFLMTTDQEEPATRLLRIVNHAEEPLILAAPECTNRAFRAALVPLKAGREYQLEVTFIPSESIQSIAAPITLETSRPGLPELLIPAQAIVRPPLVVNPPHATVPPAPLTDRVEAGVTIRNNGTNALVLSEPSVNVPGIDVEVRELQPGRLYLLVLGLPAGFRLGPDPVEAKVKTNHPRFPVIKIPVVQGRSLSASLTSSEATPGPAGTPKQDAKPNRGSPAGDPQN